MDRISLLSDDLLLKIFSSLPTKDVVSTMFLSKRWKFLWTMVPNLYFDDGMADDCYSDDEDDFSKFRRHVDRFLVSHKSPVLESLKFSLGWCTRTEDIETWIRIAIARCVRKLEIHYSCEFVGLHVPWSLYSFDKLVELKLSRSIVLRVPDPVFLSSLKSLHLLGVAYLDDDMDSHRRLLAGCPVLEEFVFDKCSQVYAADFCVVVPTLQRLSILDTCSEEEDDRDANIVIVTPSLKYLNIEDLVDHGLVCSRQSMPELLEANISIVYKSPEKLVGSFASVKRLSLCLLISEFHRQVIDFYQLAHLELCVCMEKWWDLLTWMLESSPKLQVLKLGGCKEHMCRLVEPIKDHWMEPSPVPECLLFHLNTFKLSGYNGRNEEKNMVAYILRNGKQLRIAQISMGILSSEEGPQKMKEVASLHKASESCQLRVICPRKGSIWPESLDLLET